MHLRFTLHIRALIGTGFLKHILTETQIRADVLLHLNISYFSRLTFPNLSVDFQTIFNINCSYSTIFSLIFGIYIVQSFVNNSYIDFIEVTFACTQETFLCPRETIHMCMEFFF